MNEEWRPVVGYVGWYEVSSLGRIRRLRKSNRAPAGYILKPSVGKIRGDRYIDLCRGGVHQRFLLARLICGTFHGPSPTGKNCCNHKDGDLSNNNATNLEWVSPSENMVHSYRVLGRKSYAPVGPKNGNSKTYIITDPNGKEFEITGLKHFCRQQGLRTSALLTLARGHHKGYKCRYP